MKTAFSLALVLTFSAHAQTGLKSLQGEKLYGKTAGNPNSLGVGGDVTSTPSSATKAMEAATTRGSGSDNPGANPMMNAHRAYFSSGVSDVKQTERPSRK